MARFSEQLVAVVKHWTMERAATTSDALTSVRPSVVTLAKFFLGQIPQVPSLTIHAPAIDRIDELQVLCAAVASWAGELKQEVAEDRQSRGELLERANGAQAERDLAKQKYELSVSPHPTLAELMDAMDHWVHYAQNDAILAREARDKAWAEVKRLKESLQEAMEGHKKIMELRRAELRDLRREHNLLTTSEKPKATDLVRKLAEELRAARRQQDGWQHLVAEKDEEVEKLKAELEKTNAEWKQKARDLEKEIYQKELLVKDAKVRELQKTLRERSEETQPEQLESAQKEFHDVEQRFALVKSSDLSDTSLPTFLPVLVETLRKTLDLEFDLLRQLQAVQLTSLGATTSADRDETTPETTTPSSPDIQLVVFRPRRRLRWLGKSTPRDLR
ncbi:hypothetical protein R1flu_005681 [Riccia fluitans]|uniref:Uncharacterized protein n=1 Tax=Riccia fluitans TaxID=41844 RepID=A0ABD1YTV6_9MARC